jgi:flagellar biosynthesis anti-sigma factor FlgM
VSERATEVRRLVERVLELPDVRQERVEALRARIASGDFNPSAEEIADAVIKDESQ